MTAARRAAYRRLALTVLGADVQTLLSQLQERHELPTHFVPLPVPESRAA
jgi:hypothetical protein